MELPKPKARQQGGQLPVRIANMKACSESLRFHSSALHKHQVPSHWAPGKQYFHLPTKFCEDSTVRRSGQFTTNLNRSQTHRSRHRSSNVEVFLFPVRSTGNGKLTRGADSVVKAHGQPNEHNKAVRDPYATPVDPGGLKVEFGLKKAGQGRGREAQGKRSGRERKRY
jgi:hypothetical protein